METPFAYDAGRRQIVSGVVDLMFRDATSWRIVDYKTDVRKTELATAYAEQLKMYERALAGVGIGDVTSEIHSVRIESGQG